MATLADFGTISMKWDPKNLEIRTMSVEKTLEPLVLQVTTLVNTKGPSKKKKGKKKKTRRHFWGGRLISHTNSLNSFYGLFIKFLINF